MPGEEDSPPFARAFEVARSAPHRLDVDCWRWTVAYLADEPEAQAAARQKLEEAIAEDRAASAAGFPPEVEGI